MWPTFHSEVMLHLSLKLHKAQIPSYKWCYILVWSFMWLTFHSKVMLHLSLKLHKAQIPSYKWCHILAWSFMWLKFHYKVMVHLSLKLHMARQFSLPNEAKPFLLFLVFSRWRNSFFFHDIEAEKLKFQLFLLFLNKACTLNQSTIKIPDNKVWSTL